MRRPSASRVASMFAAHPCKQGGPCQCGGGCGQQPLMMQPDYGSRPAPVAEDGESYMSVQALQSMRDHAEDLLNRVDHGSRLPDWVEAKLTRAAQSLNDVYEYMSHGKGQRLAGIRGEVNLEDEVDFGRPIRIKGFAGVRRPVDISGFEYTSGHYRVDRKDGIYLELYSDDGGPTLYGHVDYHRYEGGDISMREVAEEIRENLEDGKMPEMFARQTWGT